MTGTPNYLDPADALALLYDRGLHDGDLVARASGTVAVDLYTRLALLKTDPERSRRAVDDVERLSRVIGRLIDRIERLETECQELRLARGDSVAA
ncbi:MAG: hypothetical protein AAGA17_00260 [Actinomycetota bacterium]